MTHRPAVDGHDVTEATQIERRRERAAEEIAAITNQGQHPLFSTFEVASATTGRTYTVDIRSADDLLNSCTCPDYRTNTIGTCKHIEGVLSRLRQQLGRRWVRLSANPPQVTEVFVHHGVQPTVRVARPDGPSDQLGPVLDRYFAPDDTLQGEPLRVLPALLSELEGLTERNGAEILVRQEVRAYLDQLQDLESIRRQREWFLAQVRAGRRSLEVLSEPLYPFQHDGMLHLALSGRSLLADDMGLGKTVQAIAASVLLQQLRGIERVVIVCPASLKHQWKREIERFTRCDAVVVNGGRRTRRELYRSGAFFTIVNYELVLRDLEMINQLTPDLVILDEAQRIKNWRTKTADAVKRLESRYAFVLTGTPLENRLDELYSVFQFIDPKVLGPLWRFNLRYFEVEKRRSGSYKVVGLKNLAELRSRIRPYVLRRTRDEVLDQLPERTDNLFWVEMTAAQQEPYEDFHRTVSRLRAQAEKRALTPEEHDILMRSLLKMRMICNALALHDQELEGKQIERTAPKLVELEAILRDEVVSAGRKAILFSQWSRMLKLVEPVLQRCGLHWVKLTGKVPTHRRGELLDRFADDPDCRVFLSTDAGGVGLNLQAASVVINLDLPWNPAVLEQRIARAHRHGQRRPVQVINVLTKGTIEETMLGTLASKQRLFSTVFTTPADGDVDDAVSFKDSASSLLQQLDQLLPAPHQPKLQLEPAATRERQEEPRQRQAPLLQRFSDRLLGRYPGRVLLVQRAPSVGGSEPAPGILVVVDSNPGEIRPVAEELLATVAREDEAVAPPLLMMEREGYQALCALTGGALIAGEPQTPDEAFRAPGLPAHKPGDAEIRRLTHARRGLEQADRQARLARVLLDGGFPEEMLEPARAALGWALTGHLAVEHDIEPSAELPSARRVHSDLVEPGHLTRTLAAGLAEARELTTPADADEAPGPLSPQTCADILGAMTSLLDSLRERIASSQLIPPS